MNRYSNCMLCPRKCGVDRTAGIYGICHSPDKPRLGRAALHFWEEPCISGTKGSGAIFFTGCNLRCVYCQNYSISGGSAGDFADEHQLAEHYLRLQSEGANNINFVTGTHYVPHIIESVKIARDSGLAIPTVFNCGGYESVDTIKSLEGTIDIYLPDFKYIDTALAKKYSNALDYPELATEALDEMLRQQPKVIFADEASEHLEKGIMKKGVIVRHLLLPDNLYASRKTIKFLHDRYGDALYLSIMSQYTPVYKGEDFPELHRKVDKEVYDNLVSYAIKLGVKNAFIQEGDVAEESFIPEWNKN